MGLTGGGGGGRTNLNDGMREAGSGEVVFNLPSLGTNKIANCKKKYIKSSDKNNSGLRLGQGRNSYCCHDDMMSLRVRSVR